MKEILIKMRKIAGLSQEELAQKLGFSRPTLVAIEKGERDVTLNEIKKISKIFDIPVEVLIDDQLSVREKLMSQDFHQKSYKRFHDLVLKCIKYGADEDGKITKTKLAKLVYLCDFASYYQFLKPISGFEYHKLAQGPVAIEFFDMMDADESICVETRGKAMMVSLNEQPKTSVLTPTEEGLVKSVCKKWKQASTQEIVDFTHQQIPWKICREGEVIPYELINNEAPEDVY